jgi:hypothetical protein
LQSLQSHCLEQSLQLKKEPAVFLLSSEGSQAEREEKLIAAKLKVVIHIFFAICASSC